MFYAGFKQGYITVLRDTDRFLRIKHSVQQISEQRIRDWFFLFLCDTSLDIKDFFNIDALDCESFISIFLTLYYICIVFGFQPKVYPNHLLVVPKIINSSEIVFELWTQKFVGIEDRNEPILLSTYRDFNEMPSIGSAMFSDKLRNLMGRAMTLAAITYVPYTIAENVVYNIWLNKFNADLIK